MKEPLTNTNLSHYRIVSKIGAGGMGEVYLAEDTRLDRKVALKLLPADFAADEDRVRRFEQEARATSALNHPNILTVYDIGENEGAAFIVMEFLEGDELRGHLNDGAISQRKAIEYACQIVAGLSAAHERGIVHRDLKPENIFITKDDRVKILDFGLAKLKPAALDGGAGSEDETRKPLTNPGVVMGTIGYMSPEQVRGLAADHRSDIFSFGVILYEMLSGKKPFAGDSMVETLNAILKTDAPEFDGDGAKKISPALEKIMRRCLEKKTEHRFHSAHDLCFALEALSAQSVSSGNNLTTNANALIDGKIKPPARRNWLAWVIAGVLAFALPALGILYFSSRPSNETRAVRLYFVPPPELAFNDTLPDAAVISPDGQKIAFTATSADVKNMLYVRNLNATEAKLLPGSENALEPFWSPDSRSIAYGSNGKLKRSDLTGANSQVLCDAARLVGGTWNKDGIIVFAPDYRSALVQVSAQGGEPQPVAMKTEDNIGESHRYPYFLPDDRQFLFQRQQKGIWAGSLDSPEIKQILQDESPLFYAPPGYLFFVRNDALVAQAFDAAKLALAGDAIPIVTGQANELGTRRFSVSDNGALVWQGKWQRDYQLVWFDREGRQSGAVDGPAKVNIGQDPHISPDGKRLVVKRDYNLWVIDLEKGTGLRITSTFSQIPIWSPDGSRLAYTAGSGLSMNAANGSGEAEALVPGANFAADWSPDGRFIIFLRRGVRTRRDVWALPMSGERREYLLLNSPFDETSPHLSPDGRWLAYASDETGSYEIYVQSFSADGGKLGADKKRVSTSGGVLPAWRRDGSELFYVAADASLMSSAVKSGAAEFEFAAPKPLFKTRMLAQVLGFHEYDVSPDGNRFLVGTLVGDSKAQPPTVILNWTADLKK
ncbi:MAG: serine/threonine protein kinase [Acidobacteria bacterium]|nr:serine/threonine protein kinase [Acidobacteriota bacterium]